MQIIFDPVKDEINQAKHGLSLVLAEGFEWDGAVVWQDERRAYGEDRMCGIGYIGNRLHYVVYVDRGEARRIVSLRKANLREVNKYAKA